MELTRRGKVITFYSFKGGAGRSMALANTGVLLAKSGFKTLMIDWDLEAPGLHKYFHNRIINLKGSLDQQKGLVELFLGVQRKVRASQRSLDQAECKTLISEIDLSGYVLETSIDRLSLLKAGKLDDRYVAKASKIFWKRLFKKAEDLLFCFTDVLCEKFDFILIDSRTGYTDSSGVCTMILPEKLVLVFTPNSQGLEGVLELAKKAVMYRRASNDLRSLTLFPLPSRIENAEKELREKWRNERSVDKLGYQPAFENLLEEIYETIGMSLSHYFDDVQIQHEPKYAYGEEIAVLDDPSKDRLSLSESYNRFLNHLLADQEIWTLKDRSKRKVYMSYTSEDKDLAIPLSNALRSIGFKVWNDEGFLPGENYLSSVQKALTEAELIIPIISSHYANSKSAAFELSFFLEQKRLNGKKNVLSVQVCQKMPQLSSSLNEYLIIESKGRNAQEIADDIDVTLEKLKKPARPHYILDKLSLHSSVYGNIKCHPFPPHLTPAAALFTEDEDEEVMSVTAAGVFGSFLLHEVRMEEFSISLSEFRLEVDMDLQLCSENESLGIHFILKNNLRHTVRGFPEGFILKHQYNMLYTPQMHWEYLFRRSEEYAVFSIHFSTPYLSQCIDTFPELSKFMKDVKRKNPAFMSPTHHPHATPEMMAVVHNILFCNYTGTLRKMYLESKVPELLLLVVEGIDSSTSAVKVPLGPGDLQKLQKAKEYIVQNMVDPGTIKQLAYEVGINEYKLKYGFKQMYGTTVFGLLLDERMKRARALLRDTSLSTKEISVMTGYKNLSNFTAAFKRKFGYAPHAIQEEL